jgi:RNA polymerase sigma factor (sigma-70 family)
MDTRPPLSAPDYWYLGSPDPAIDLLFRRACGLAWPYAVYCATRYHHDSQVAYELMDAAVENAERYYERFNGQRSAIQLSYRIISVIKRTSRQRANRNEVTLGTLSELDLVTQAFQSKTDTEQDVIMRQILARMSERTRQVVRWREAGHSWRQIADELGADHITVWRQTTREIRGLLELKSDTHDPKERGERD